LPDAAEHEITASNQIEKRLTPSLKTPEKRTHNVGLSVGLAVAAKDKLTAIKIKNAAPGLYGDGGGLYLHRTEDGGKWIYRFTFAGRRRDMGLGALSAVSLAQARKERDRWAAVRAAGRDPISVRAQEKNTAAAEAARCDPTLEDLVALVFDARKATLKDNGASGRWLSPIRVHIFPTLGARPASSLTASDFVRALSPIWNSKPTVAVKAFARLRLVFRKARAIGHRVDPATIEAAREMLGDLHIKHEHIEATPWQDIPALFQRLHGDTSGRACLRFLILTAVRSDAARGARLSEFDGTVWTIPPERIKGTLRAAEAFRVPLSKAALEIVETARHLSNDRVDGLLFPGPLGGALSQNALTNVLNDMHEAGRPHGFRTSFRTWVQDTASASYEVAETALGHKIGGRVERSYARSDYLDQRAALMQRWADHVAGSDTVGRS